MDPESQQVSVRRRNFALFAGVLLSVFLVIAAYAGVSAGLIHGRAVTTTVVSITTSTATSITAVSIFTSVTNSLDTSGGFPFPGTDCLAEIPANATLGAYGAANIDGVYATVVTYPDGINASFPVEGCPQPVPQVYFQQAVEAVTNSTFVKMENGSESYFAGAGPTMTLAGNMSAEALVFNEYANGTDLSGCSATFGQQILGQIQVYFFPGSSGGPPILSDPRYLYVPRSSLTSCP